MPLPIYYSHLDVGSPDLNGPGTLIDVLNACLVTGYNSRPVTSIAIASGVATITTQTDHFFDVGHTLLLSGSGVAAMNGQMRVLSTPTSNTFTVATTATGSDGAGATVKRAPLGWTKPFSGPNKAIYKSADPAACGQMLYVDDDFALLGTDESFYGKGQAKVFGLESATAIDAWGFKFPAGPETYVTWAARNLLGTRRRGWLLVGDSRYFYLLTEGPSAYGGPDFVSAKPSWFIQAFGDIVSYKSADVYGSMLSGGSRASASSWACSTLLNHGEIHQQYFGDVTNPTDVLCRNHSGFSGAAVAYQSQPYGFRSGASTIESPSVIDNTLIFAQPVFISEQAGIRGEHPGLVNFIGKNSSFMVDTTKANCGFTFHTATDGSGERFLVAPSVCMGEPYSNQYTFAVRLNSAWR